MSKRCASEVHVLSPPARPSKQTCIRPVVAGTTARISNPPQFELPLFQPLLINICTMLPVDAIIRCSMANCRLKIVAEASLSQVKSVATDQIREIPYRQAFKLAKKLINVKCIYYNRRMTHLSDNVSNFVEWFRTFAAYNKKELGIRFRLPQVRNSPSEQSFVMKFLYWDADAVIELPAVTPFYSSSTVPSKTHFMPGTANSLCKMSRLEAIYIHGFAGVANGMSWTYDVADGALDRNIRHIILQDIHVVPDKSKLIQQHTCVDNHVFERRYPNPFFQGTPWNLRELQLNNVLGLEITNFWPFIRQIGVLEVLILQRIPSITDAILSTLPTKTLVHVRVDNCPNVSLEGVAAFLNRCLAVRHVLLEFTANANADCDYATKLSQLLKPTTLFQINAFAMLVANRYNAQRNPVASLEAINKVPPAYRFTWLWALEGQLFEQLGEYTKAAESLSHAPRVKEAARLRMKCLERLGQFSHCIATGCYIHALVTPGALLKKINYLFNMDAVAMVNTKPSHQDIITLCRCAVAAHPRDVPLRERLGDIYYSAGDYKSALDAYSRAIYANNKTASRSYTMRCYILCILEKFDLAIRAFDQVVYHYSSDGRGEPAYIAAFCYEFACYVQQRYTQTEMALKAIERAITVATSANLDEHTIKEYVLYKQTLLFLLQTSYSVTEFSAATALVTIGELMIQ